MGTEFGKAVSKETNVDILVTPGVTLFAGGLTATFIGPAVKLLMNGIGLVIMKATELHPFFMGMIVSVIVGLVLTSPLSSTALCIMLNLSGISAGAGMGTCGFVGQIFTLTDMGINARSIISVVLLHFVLPICLSLFFDWILRKKGKIKAGDYYFEL